jgi:hypothetical protein
MPEANAVPETDLKFTLDQDQRLSQSILWQLQRNYFQHQGIEAWSQGAVPHYITSNPFIAEAYARVVLGFLRDWQAAAQANNDSAALDPAEPVYIIELGAGPGRFGFHFLTHFHSLLGRSELRGLAVKYILTDLAERNIDYWCEHPALQPFIASGALDFARFDAEQCQDLRLIRSGEVLTGKALKNPVIVLANYFFDAIPQDVFYLHHGQLHEGRVNVSSSQQESDLSDPEVISRVQVAFEHVPVNEDIYEDAAFNRILQGYSQRLAETTILFPIAALRCIRFFLELSGQRLLLLSADKGFHWEEDILSWTEPELVIHGGCFSMTLNYHALEQYILNLGGKVLHTSHHYTSLDIVAFLLGTPPGNFSETAQAFERTIERFGPSDLFNLIQSIGKSTEDMSLEQILSWLRLSSWDSNLLLNFFPALMSHAATVPEPLKEELYWVIQYVRNTHYDIGEGQNIEFYLGTLLCSMGYYSEALKYLEYSLQHSEPDMRILYNMSLCYLALHQTDDALEYIKQGLAIDPSSEPARALRIKIESTIDRQALRSMTW